MKARRLGVARAVFRKRRWWLAALGVVLVGLLAAAVVTRTSALGVSAVEVSGAERTGSDAVIAAAAIRSGAPLLTLPTDEIARRIEALPWVAQATVRRNWPRGVEVEVRERRPAAVIALGSAWALADLTGRVLSVEPASPIGFVPLSGPLPGSPAPGDQLPAEAAGAVRVGAVVPASLRPQITAIRWDRSGNVVLELQRGGVAELGRAERPDDQLVSLATVLPALPPGDVGTIDLRAPAVPVVEPPVPAEDDR